MPDGDLQLRFAPDTGALAEMRAAFGDWLAQRAAAQVVDELVLVADELCANAIEAADGGFVSLEARWDGSAVHLAVSNAGHAPPGLSRADREPVADVLRERGRGLTIVRAFTDSLAVVNVDGHTVARAVRLLS
jgi:anti-sigma regulatory factor (Ser/Thr protein kinase)